MHWINNKNSSFSSYFNWFFKHWHECDYCPLQVYEIHGRLRTGLSPAWSLSSGFDQKSCSLKVQLDDRRKILTPHKLLLWQTNQTENWLEMELGFLCVTDLNITIIYLSETLLFTHKLQRSPICCLTGLGTQLTAKHSITIMKHDSDWNPLLAIFDATICPFCFCKCSFPNIEITRWWPPAKLLRSDPSRGKRLQKLKDQEFISSLLNLTNMVLILYSLLTWDFQKRGKTLISSLVN